MKIQITAGGIYDSTGKEIPIGTEMSLKAEPLGWAGRYMVLTGKTEGKTAVTNPAGDDLKAVHRGGGSYSIMRGDKPVEEVESLSKEDAEAFNALSSDEKAAFIAKPAE